MHVRIAVFSDIHGNCIALDAMLADFNGQSIDLMVCLGDAIQGGPQPAQVVQRLRELGCPVVMGNADAWLLTGKRTDDEAINNERQQRMEAVRQWSLSQLSDDDRAFIAAFQPTIELALDDDFRPKALSVLLAYHGSPKSFNDVILPDIAQDKLAAFLDGHRADAYCGGHTHVQFVRRIGAGPEVHFNPGSVGIAASHHQPDEGFQADPWAEYAVLDVDARGGRWALEFHRAPFDVEALIAGFEASGRPRADAAIAEYRRRA